MDAGLRGWRGPHTGHICSRKEPCVHNLEESQESRKRPGQWAWRVWWGQERFQSLDGSARMVTGEGAQLSGWGLCWGWVSHHRAEAGSRVQRSVATVPGAQGSLRVVGADP